MCAFPTWMTRPSLWRGAPRQKPSLASWSKPRPHPRPRATYPFRGPSNPACVHTLLQVNINRKAEKRQGTTKTTTLTELWFQVWSQAPRTRSTSTRWKGTDAVHLSHSLPRQVSIKRHWIRSDTIKYFMVCSKENKLISKVVYHNYFFKHISFSFML